MERKISTVQECLDKHEVNGRRLHATGLQTFCKLIENEMNNLSGGYSFGCDADNSPLLKLIFPNMLTCSKMVTSFISENKKVSSHQNGRWVKLQILKSKDVKVRRCTVQYQNAPENVARFTDRAA